MLFLKIMDHIHRETLLRKHHDNIQSMDQSKESRDRF